MLKDHSQLQLSLSPYQGLCDAIIPADHLLRRIKENIDFSFVNPMLRKQYCENFGRPAKEPEMMFKRLFLKKLYDLSDEALISSAQTDMAYKFFLDIDVYKRQRLGCHFLDAGSIEGIHMYPYDYMHLSPDSHELLARKLSELIPDLF